MKSLEDLKRIREQAQAQIKLRTQEANTKIIVGMGTCGIAAGARETLMAILDELSKRNIQDVVVTQTGCVGLCEYEPLVNVVKPGQPKITYMKVTPERARQIVASHIVNDQIINEWVLSTEEGA
ncbi:MAG TPA: (2Fe-2S) ferredoxin domain-containing protein [bacterium]|nr:(2Fe-2S) ferredoxin domain-containing protein [bacterium]HOK28959.1 (2Fe-2S) ferredoxin domain-containing protein [bacterium]HOL54671.1 (2Fe-2S) ferredoxin domain-containing protein [bacterium]HON72972.1 (2Fe-2S) ferredoxin domain-containing protein [bacterium]HOP55200.1 (2Fe-2S) ferredoxin domain-containing protein [bacterium]